MPNYTYFTLRELTNSSVAEKNKIDNTPSFEVVEHLSELVDKILEPMRAAYGKAITVTSGYRCAVLNKAVGGVANSAHIYGYAADLRASDMAGFKKFVREWLISQRVRFDQCILESNGSTEWVHVGLYSPSGAQRGKIFTMNV